MTVIHNGKKYTVEVRAGASEQDLELIEVNNESNPFPVESSEFVGRIAVRIQGFDGVSPNGEPIATSPYFNNVGRLLSIQIQGRFKRDWNADDLMWGIEFHSKFKVPKLAGIALKFVQYTFDPCLDADLHADKPYARSSLFAAMNTINSQDSGAEGTLPQWPTPNGEHLIEDLSSSFDKEMDTNARRKYFSKVENRKSFPVKSNLVYSMDFFNPILDFSKFKIQVPAVKFSINMMKYYNGEPLRYACKSRDHSVTFFVIQFDLKEILHEKTENAPL
eukprot:TRINITY_DN7374_c0_g1_i1.p1 TRINITY_DN7374_c0_g1~~TRINITY_DN7374_c0_g1_i1.p1  ORF type:complete len:276 (+),score=61.61 TRINITY_DN7374_c0_g1_i1:61-888(+)